MKSWFHFGNSNDMKFLGQAEMGLFVTTVTLIAEFRVYADKWHMFVFQYEILINISK